MECLNCQTITSENFCPNCGQKSSTTRFSIKSFFKEGILEAVFSVNKGFFFTLKALFTRPGYAIREYINGRRANYINFSTLVLILLSINYLLTQYGYHSYSDIVNTQSSDISSAVDQLLKEHQKALMIFMIPIGSLLTYWFFKKSKLNYSEHIVLNTYKTSGELIFTLLISVADLFITDRAIILNFGVFIMFVTIAYNIWLLHQFFSSDGYSLIGTAFKTIMISLFIVFISAILMVIYIVASGSIDVTN